MGNKKKNTYEDLKVCDCGNGKIMAVMNKETWETIAQIIEWANTVYKEKKREAGLY